MISKSILNYPSIKSTLIDLGDGKNQFIVEPLLHGYGYTLGNSLRRILLSSIPGCAVVAVRVNDLTHEYQSIDGVVEDVIDVILNLKNLKVRILSDDDRVSIKLNRSTTGEVTAADFEEDGRVEVINKELFICYLSKDIDLDIEVEVAKGVGYLSSDKIDYVGNIDPQKILVDALFSPISDVSLNIEQVRVGDKTDYDKLILNFNTNETLSGTQAINFSLTFLNDLFLQIGSGLKLENILTKEEGDIELQKLKDEEDRVKLEVQKIADESQENTDIITIEDETILAILEKNEILTNIDLVDLVQNRIHDLNEFAGLKKKHIKDIQKYVKNLNK
jgi:DNA-directed RNA polymerase subunit alpha